MLDINFSTVGKLIVNEGIYLFVLAAIVILWAFYFSIKRGELPPGPNFVTLIGNAHQLFRNPLEKFMEWSKIYGPIFHLRLGLETMIIVSEAKLVKELLNHKFTTGRSVHNPIVVEMTKGSYGIGNAEGETWQEQRTFTLKALQILGFNKSSMENRILNEVKATLSFISKREGIPTACKGFFNDPVINALWNIVTGKAIEKGAGQSYVAKTTGKMLEAFERVTTNGLVFVPFVRNIFPNLNGWNEYVTQTSKFQSIFEEEVKSRKLSKLRSTGTNEDFVNSYIDEIENTTNPKSSFYTNTGYKNLVGCLADLFIGNFETSSLTLTWALLYIGLHPEVQTQIHAEIDQVMKCNTSLPTLSNRPDMPYLEAVIMETMRKSSVVALALPHVVIQDLTFNNYTFKKGSTILANLHGIHNDPEVWGDPEKFRPNRFLTMDGSKVMTHESLIPFSEGKRKCIGEKMAKEQLFLFMAGIFGKYKIDLDECGKKLDMSPGSASFVMVPPKFNVIFSPRAL